MSINGLTLQSGIGALPFVPLNQEMMAFKAAPVVDVKLWPVSAGAKSEIFGNNKNIRFKGHLFVTSQRLLFLNSDESNAVHNLVILHRQLTLAKEEVSPIALVMPWFGTNSLVFEFKILPEQSLNNGPWLDNAYTWRCELTLEKRSRDVSDLFQLHDSIKSALASNAVGARAEEEEEEPLPEYVP
ncbi:LAME_0F01794g1_1 [Lachancea meyersii CBS 8951]|uniref:LAME_0F01794g1_1 n=1 Tax=Lachancea meyersii CBS 8951 TaxID=1266667 RepID=A0A1G4JQ01_9SACH|nr:LAME_0F01794g1_1 [Lachancea meyersii CBS 8951]